MYPIPINTTGFLLVLSFSTVVTPFAETDRSGCHIINIVIYFTNPPGCSWSPIIATTTNSPALPLLGSWLSTLGCPCLDAVLTQFCFDALLQQTPSHMPLSLPYGSDYPAWSFSAWTLSIPVALQYPTLRVLTTPCWAASLCRCRLNLLRYWHPHWATMIPFTPAPFHAFFTLPSLLFLALNCLEREEGEVGF